MKNNNFTMQPDSRFRIKIADGGPYLVFGRPPLSLHVLAVDSDGRIRRFERGRSFNLEADPAALCRCGQSRDKPYCDGSHRTAAWNPALRASRVPFLQEAEILRGPNLTLADNRRLCVYARFCDADGRTWHNVEHSDRQREYETALRQAGLCPNSRLSVFDDSGRQLEPVLETELGLVEDPQSGVSGGLRLTGGISVSTQDGFMYEVRNRAVLCRCGHSSNMPYCDATHVPAGFRDGLSRT